MTSSSSSLQDLALTKVSPEQRRRAATIDPELERELPARGTAARAAWEQRVLRHGEGRVILCLDQDCFYAQCVMVANKDLRKVPLGVTQKYLVVTANYPARKFGVTKLMGIAEAKQRCPSLVLVPGERLDAFRQHSKEIQACVAQQLRREWCAVDASGESNNSTIDLERSGMDELFMDITALCRAMLLHENKISSTSRSSSIKRNDNLVVGHVVGELRLCSRDSAALFRQASRLAASLRLAMRTELGFESCAGISSTKIAAKLAVNAYKPNDQTILLPHAILPVLLHMELRRLTGIGYRTARLLQQAELPPCRTTNGEEDRDRGGIVTVADALRCDFDTLLRALQGNRRVARLVYFVCRGLDESEVKSSGAPTLISVEDSMRAGSCTTEATVRGYLIRIAADLVIRLEEDASENDNRRPTSLTLKFRLARQSARTLTTVMPVDGQSGGGTMAPDRVQILCDSAMALFHRAALDERFSLTVIGLAAGKFVETGTLQQRSLTAMLRQQPTTTDHTSSEATAPAALARWDQKLQQPHRLPQSVEKQWSCTQCTFPRSGESSTIVTSPPPRTGIATQLRATPNGSARSASPNSQSEYLRHIEWMKWMDWN